MTISQLDETLERYQRAIEEIEGLKVKTPKPAVKIEKTIAIEQVIETLNARNDVQLALQELKRVPTSRLQRVIELDERLRELAADITKWIKTQRWSKLRSSVHPPDDAWWWKLETVAPVHKWDSLDDLWKGLTVVLWTGNLSLLLNVATRFLGGGAGFWGAAAVIFPSLVALLQASSELTASGKAGFDDLLTRLNIPLHFQEEARLGLTLFVSGFLLTLWVNLPRFSQSYSYEGIINYTQGKIGNAEQSYLKAISIDPENLDAHFNLGNVYEDLRELDKAKKHYAIAVRGNIPDAYNNLARLYIKDNKNKQYAQAAALLNTGLELAREQKSNPEVKYSLFKNLGWVRLKQGRNQEAQKNLEAAINVKETADSLKKDSNYSKYIQNMASAHCILGQVLDGGNEQRSIAALEQWQKCCELADRRDPDEDSWLYQAQQKLKNAGRGCKNTKDS